MFVVSYVDVLMFIPMRFYLSRLAYVNGTSNAHHIKQLQLIEHNVIFHACTCGEPV